MVLKHEIANKNILISRDFKIVRSGWVCTKTCIIIFGLVTHPLGFLERKYPPRKQHDNVPLSETHPTLQHDYQYRRDPYAEGAKFWHNASEGCITRDIPKELSSYRSGIVVR